VVDVLRSVVAWATLGCLLCALSLACGPTLAPATPTPSFDAFAVVRATSQAAYASGKAHLDRGEYLLACVDLDVARTNDPDARPDIQQALEQALQRCLTPSAEAAGSPAATALALPTIVVPTVAAVAAQGTPGAPAPAANLVTWNDPQGRFSIGSPANWPKVDRPVSFVGVSVVEFSDPSGRAEVDVAVDTSARAVSPELYAAGLELAMQQQLAGYAPEQALPTSTAGNPSVRRVFTFTQRDASGQEHQARAFQITIVKGTTPYLVSGTAPAPDFQQFNPIFDQMVQSFRFS
jgi:hypothetical protein